MRERTAEGEAMERRRRRRRIARSVVDDASRLLSGPGLFARRTDRWAIVSRWLQHVRGCLKYRDRTGPPVSLSLSLCPPSSLAPTHSLRGSWPCFGGSRARSGSHRDTHGRAGTCAPFPSGPSRWGIWAPVNGIVPILSSLPPPSNLLLLCFFAFVHVLELHDSFALPLSRRLREKIRKFPRFHPWFDEFMLLFLFIVFWKKTYRRKRWI